VSSWSGRTVFVTGADGFIGSHLAERLVELGATTRALVLYNSTHSWGWLDESPLRHEMEIVMGDVRDGDTLRAPIHGADVVFHLAALIAIPYSYSAPQSYVRTNVDGTLNVIEAARRASVARVVHTSTSEVYGTAVSVPIREDHPLHAQSPYAASKIGADKLAESYHLSFDLPVVTVRPFNTYGPRQSARAIIPTVVTQALAGDTVSVGNVTPTRDFTFVADTVDGMVRAADAEGVVGRVVNLGNGQEISINELVLEIARLLDVSVEVTVEEQRKRPAASEVERLCADATLARELLGWEPQVPLTEGLTRTIDWIRGNRDRYKTGLYAV
jgi:dTDP-glucose 4,6-dehydratase